MIKLRAIGKGCLIIAGLIMLQSCNLFGGRGIIDDIGAGTGAPGTLSDLFGSPAEVNLAAPTSLHASEAEFPDRVLVSWTSVDGADYYEISRAVEPGDFLELGKSYSETYTDSTLDAGETAVYRIRAYNRETDSYGPWSSGSGPAYLLAPPGRFSASKGRIKGRINLNWQAARGAGGYLLYCSTSAICPDEPLKRLTAIDQSYSFEVSEQDTGVKFYFWLRALNKRRGSGRQSSELSCMMMGFSLVPGAPPYPKNVIASEGAGNSGIWINWEAGEADYYRIYRWSEKNSSQEEISPPGLTGSVYHDTDTDMIKPGVRYYYTVQAVKGEFESGYSDPAEGYLLSAPQLMTAVRDGSDTVLSWKPVPGLSTPAEVALHSGWRYILETAPDKSGPFTELTANIIPSADGDTVFRHENPPDKVYYRLLTCNGTDLSLPSAVFEALPDRVAGLQAGMNAVPAGGEHANRSGVYPVPLSWQASPGAVSYRISRASNPDGRFRTLGETGALNFTDDSVDRTPGNKYSYRVKALNSLGMSSPESTAVNGWGAVTDEIYLTEFNSTSVLPAKAMLPLGDLTEVTKNGAVAGTVYYKAQMSPAGAVIHYNGFCHSRNNRNEPLFILDGNMDTHISNVVSRSGKMAGTVTTSGMYPGRIYYDNIIIDNSRDAGGTYGVQQDGRARTELSWELLK